MVGHMLDYKTSLNTFKMIESISSIFSDHNRKNETRYQLQKEKWEKNKHMKTKHHATKKTNGSMKKSKRKSENTLRQMNMETQHSKIYRMQQKNFQEGSS